MIQGASVPSHSSQSVPMETNTPDPCNLIVNYIPTPVTDEDLRELFEPFGVVVSARVIVDRVTNHPKGYGFVKYTTKEAAKEAIRQMNGYKIQNKHLRVTQANGPQNHSRPPNESSSPSSSSTPLPPPPPPQVIHFVSTAAAFPSPQPQYTVLGADNQIFCTPQGAQPMYSVLVTPPPQTAAPQPLGYFLHPGQPHAMYDHLLMPGGVQQSKPLLLSNPFSLGGQAVTCTASDHQGNTFPQFSQGSLSGQISATGSTPSNCTSSQGLTLSNVTMASPTSMQNLDISNAM